MSILKVILLAFVQGVTEFVPISSSGHLVLTREFLGWSDKGGMVMDVALHAGSLVAILVYFRRDWLNMLAGIFRVRGRKARDHRRLFWLIVAATIPAAVVGPFIERQMYFFRRGWIVGLIMMTVACWFLFCEWKKRGGPNEMNLPTALAMGVAQVFGLFPGASRAGVTIGAGLLCGRKREHAARFSFLMAVPAIFGAAAVTAVHALGEGIERPAWSLTLIGFVACFLVSYASIHFCLKLFRRHSLVIFAVYLLALGLVFVAVPWL